ncbi:MAG: ribonuclease P protein subunit [Candidatus Nanohalarchaeota archaeon]|nr:MAG: ribonuclease P protein subunit [Candidatus Nanohaloarchaeota archaeon]
MRTVPANPKNITRHELINLEAKILTSKDLNMLHLTGTIINETQKTLTIKTKKKAIITAKKDNTYKITLKDKTQVKINGKLLYGRPEDRIKKKTKNKWKLV